MSDSSCCVHLKIQDSRWFIRVSLTTYLQLTTRLEVVLDTFDVELVVVFGELVAPRAETEVKV